ncbi:hypothetical protein NUU61_001585 [Penicillium alfredii]|uniref:Uncharacterized protein n=1 Tax=Penicillium alfredii TaxID=1506179 RepID=A0A9W9G2C7_9EURO|nr:uncharacterized protein NUU61_001617 [Penicillium alfredii]XP_056515138.1 uncharacterized protein NUU61_001289 [Penicillium alfredii]XP_056515434.1 uncharacterized protein NUU61_001585 [Penicillium alfredii]KAJ5110360.1 hypothetical protein NUU61_001617 [Penicillium alfredii]KAJ5111659.1 hypothetical protein NUU61_001289 [Penicillium alfredii]KAJ5111955.1 hypothetical protein NUU61_001585 [Penicillium alfredii]
MIISDAPAHPTGRLPKPDYFHLFPSASNALPLSMPDLLRPSGTIYLKYGVYEHCFTAIHDHSDFLRRYETTQQYLEFSGVTGSDLDSLSSDQNRPSKSIRLGYHYSTQVPLVNLMSGWNHEDFAGSFRMIGDEQLFAM